MVSHGAVRTAEVTARFTLDALPGKQMAIDADLNAGIIDESQARARGGILRRDGRRGPFQPARCAGYSADYRCQYHCRISDRRISTRHSVSRGIADVHRADRGRWPGDHDPVAAGFDGRRHCSDTRLFRQLAHNDYERIGKRQLGSRIDYLGDESGPGGIIVKTKATPPDARQEPSSVSFALAQKDGAFTLYNSRNKYEKSYK